MKKSYVFIFNLDVLRDFKLNEKNAFNIRVTISTIIETEVETVQ